MSNPKHKNPRPDRTAIAPYNFVPLPEKVVTVDTVPDHDCYHTDRRTGYIACELTTLTPFYTRCMMTPSFFDKWADNMEGLKKDNEARKKYAQPFHIKQKSRPVIPGSSLRGMVRSLVEIAGYGKMAWVGDEQLIYRQVFGNHSIAEYYRGQTMGENKAQSGGGNHFDYPLPNLQAGYLKQSNNSKSGWEIQPAKKWQGESFVLVNKSIAEQNLNKNNNFVKVYIYPVSRVAYKKKNIILDIAKITSNTDIGLQRTAPTMKQAVLLRPNYAPNRRWYPAIYEVDNDAQSIPISDDLKKIYIEDCKIPRGDRKIRELKEDGDPLFYLVDKNNDLVFFGHTMMFRLPYPNTPYDLIPKEIRLPHDKKEGNNTQTDLAEAIFGYIDGDDEKRLQAYAGRVFFTDAHYETAEKGLWLIDKNDGVMTPKILSGPKPTTFQHYLTQKSDDPKQLHHYGSSSEETTIRGHKLYWHKKDIKLQDIQETPGDDPDRPDVQPKPTKNDRERKKVTWENDTQHTQIKPVNDGVTFGFKIHFENLNDVELGALLWVLDLPEGHHHKLGMGKPLGMGSVKIELKLYLTSRCERYETLFSEDGWQTGGRLEQDVKVYKNAFTSEIKQQLKSQTDFEALERIQSLLKILEWHGPDMKDTEYMELENFKLRHVLPNPLDSLKNNFSESSKSPGGGQKRNNQSYSSHSKKQYPSKKSVPIPKIGEEFTGEVIEINALGDIIIEHPKISRNQLRVVIRAKDSGGKQFRVGNQAKCKVIGEFNWADKPGLNCKSPKKVKRR